MKLIKKLWNEIIKDNDDAATVILAVCIIIGIILLAVAIFVGVTALEACLLMWLWNLVIPALWATAPKLSFWLAVGLIFICKILFKSASIITQNTGGD